MRLFPNETFLNRQSNFIKRFEHETQFAFLLQHEIYLSINFVLADARETFRLNFTTNSLNLHASTREKSLCWFSIETSPNTLMKAFFHNYSKETWGFITTMHPTFTLFRFVTVLQVKFSNLFCLLKKFDAIFRAEETRKKIAETRESVLWKTWKLAKRRSNGNDFRADIWLGNECCKTQFDAFLSISKYFQIGKNCISHRSMNFFPWWRSCAKILLFAFAHLELVFIESKKRYRMPRGDKSICTLDFTTHSSPNDGFEIRFQANLLRTCVKAFRRTLFSRSWRRTFRWRLLFLRQLHAVP